MRAPLLTLAAVATLAAALAGCRPRPANGAIARQRFVVANTELRSVSDTAAKGDSLRKAALRRHRVSEADLRRFVDVHGRSPEYMASVWREVADSVQKRYDRVDSVRAARLADSTARLDVPPPRVETPAPPRMMPPVARPPVALKPPAAPRPPPPPATESPRPMVRPPPTRRPPAGPPPDTRGPVTRPNQPPLARPDTILR